jgi:cytochrome c oxidase subunit 3
MEIAKVYGIKELWNIGTTYNIDEVRRGFAANPDLLIRTQMIVVNGETGASNDTYSRRVLFKLNK